MRGSSVVKTGGWKISSNSKKGKSPLSPSQLQTLKIEQQKEKSRSDNEGGTLGFLTSHRFLNGQWWSLDELGKSGNRNLTTKTRTTTISGNRNLTTTTRTTTVAPKKMYKPQNELPNTFNDAFDNFDELEINGDDFLSRTEFLTFLSALRSKKKAKHGFRYAFPLSCLDSISLQRQPVREEDASVGMTAEGAGLFHSFDFDLDGKLSKIEFAKLSNCLREEWMKDKKLKSAIRKHQEYHNENMKGNNELEEVIPHTNTIIRTMMQGIQNYEPDDSRACNLTLPEKFINKTTEHHRVYSVYKPALDAACQAFHHLLHDSHILKSKRNQTKNDNVDFDLYGLNGPTADELMEQMKNDYKSLQARYRENHKLVQNVTRKIQKIEKFHFNETKPTPSNFTKSILTDGGWIYQTESHEKFATIPDDVPSLAFLDLGENLKHLQSSSHSNFLQNTERYNRDIFKLKEDMPKHEKAHSERRRKKALKMMLNYGSDLSGKFLGGKNDAKSLAGYILYLRKRLAFETKMNATTELYENKVRYYSKEDTKLASKLELKDLPELVDHTAQKFDGIRDKFGRPRVQLDLPPEDWTTIPLKDGRKYYWNKKEDKVLWERPFLLPGEKKRNSKFRFQNVNKSMKRTNKINSIEAGDPTAVQGISEQLNQDAIHLKESGQLDTEIQKLMPHPKIDNLRKHAIENQQEAMKANSVADAWADRAHYTWLLLQQALREYSTMVSMLSRLKTQVDHAFAYSEILKNDVPPDVIPEEDFFLDDFEDFYDEENEKFDDPACSTYECLLVCARRKTRNYRKAATAAKWLKAIAKLSSANLQRAEFGPLLSLSLRTFISSIIQIMVCGFDADDKECDSDKLDGRIDQVCLSSRLEDKDWCNNANYNCADASGISFPKRRECTAFAAQKESRNFLYICIKIFGCEVFDNLYCLMKRKGKKGDYNQCAKTIEEQTLQAAILTKGTIESFKNTFDDFLKKIKKWAATLKQGWLHLREANDLKIRTHYPEPFYWDQKDATVSLYNYLNQANYWNNRQQQVQLRITMREREESLALDNSEDNEYFWDDTLRVVKQKASAAKKSALKYAELYDGVIEDQKRRRGILPPLPPRKVKKIIVPREPPEPMPVKTLGYNEGKSRCDIITEPSLNNADCKARKIEIARQKRASDAANEILAQWNEAKSKYGEVKSLAIAARKESKLSPIQWPDRPPTYWIPPCEPHVRASGNCQAPIPIDETIDREQLKTGTVTNDISGFKRGY
eukprot:g2224.t1